MMAKKTTSIFKSYTNQIHEILGINDIFRAPDRMMEILLDKPKREEVFMQFLDLFDGNVVDDMFHAYYQEEAAQRSKMKQDFTPPSLGKLLAEIVQLQQQDGTYYECAAGTGGLMIAKWNEERMKADPFTYKPSDYFYHCEDLSDRALPFLIFNMAIRGMNGVVVHCDSLTRECYGAFFIQNDYNCCLKFSNINVMPYTDLVARELQVKFIEERYPVQIESPWPFDMSIEEVKQLAETA